ncbi:MAG TPA: mechanosensitive ion channel family protein [Acidimicrobiia bacterium]|nr:mechanosensitive ion channel family protein [Acidimicrobiia bacterium]
MLENLIGRENQGNLIGSLVAIAVFILLYFLLKRVSRRVLTRIAGRGPAGESRVVTLEQVTLRFGQVAILVAFLIVIGGIWEINLGGVLALGAVFGAALGFGAQDLVKDLIGGFFILSEDQFHIGDVVRIADTEGTVEDIQFRVTVLRDVEGNKHFVPNGQITVSSNYTAIYAQPVLDVGIAYKADVDRALAVMKDELESMANSEEFRDSFVEPPEVLGVQDLADSAVIIRARLRVLADQRWTVLREARRRIKIRFDEEGIEIPFPHMTVYQGEA